MTRLLVLAVLGLYLVVFAYVAIYLTVFDRKRGASLGDALPANILSALCWPMLALNFLAVYGSRAFDMDDEDDEDGDG